MADTGRLQPAGSQEATDKEIDALGYELYGLSDEEIWIVEEATAT